MEDLSKYNYVMVDGRVILHTQDPSIVRAIHILYKQFRQTPGEVRIGHPTVGVTTMHHLPEGVDVQFRYSVSDPESVKPDSQMLAVASSKPEERTIPLVNQGFADDAILRSHPDFK